MITRVVMTVFLLPSLIVPLVSVALFAARLFVLPIFLRLPLVHRLLRPFLAHFVRGKDWVSFGWFGLGCRAWAVGMGTCAVWEWAEAVFEAYVKQVRPAPRAYLVPPAYGTN